MYTDLTLKNFRVFDDEGVCIPLRPITILTGCNNSGKSSITKALCLLKDFCHQIEKDFNDGKNLQLERYKMDFHKKPNDIMGSFNLVVHHQTQEAESDNVKKDDSRGKVSYEIVVESSWLLQDVIVHLDFSTLEGDDLKNGYLDACSIRTYDGGKVIYKASSAKKASIDFSVVKKALLNFLCGQRAVSSWQNELNYRMASSTSPAGEDKEAQEFEEAMTRLINDVGCPALVYMLEWQVSNCLKPWKDGTTGPASAVFSNIDSSFAENSPKMNVFCYFPCLEKFQKTRKKKVREIIYDKIASQEKGITPLVQKVLDLFLTSFEKSKSKTLFDFISEKENVFFKDSKIISFGKSKFPLSFYTFMKHEFSSYLFYEQQLNEEEDLPKEANIDICIYALDYINQLMTDTSQTYKEYDEINEIFKHKYERFLDDFLRRIIEDIFSKIMPGSFSYSPTTIVRPQRLYSLEDDSDFTNTLKKYFEIKRMWESEVGNDKMWEYQHKDKEKHLPCTFINKWLSQLGIAHHVEIRTHANGYGVTVHLYDNENDTTGMLLADKGFGVLQLFAFLLKIENAILETQINEVRYPNYTSGLSKEVIKWLRTYNQLHPITIALEEPECHLHPSLQSQFADIIVDANEQFGIHFLIESHSEYLIRKLQLLVSQKKIKNKDVSLLYVNPQKRPSYMPAVNFIGIEPDGALGNEFGTGFYDESIRLSNELFKSMKDKNEE